MPSNTKDFTVAIVGGGMCGLACTYGLTSAGIKVDVFEAAANYHEVGAGVGLGPNAIRALKELGLLDAVLKAAGETKANQRLFYILSGTDNHEKIFDYDDSSGEEGRQGLGVYRPGFLDAIMPLLDQSIIHFHKRCTGVEKAESGRQLLYFSDNTTFEADLIIGADGIKSITRKAIVGVDDHLLGFSGSYAYRALVPIEALLTNGIKTDVKSRPHCWAGVGKVSFSFIFFEMIAEFVIQHIITFPIKNDTLLSVVAFYTVGDGNLMPERPHPWVETVPEAELMVKFSDWGSDALTILKHMVQPTKWSIHTIYPPIKNFINGSVVLIGDAAHGMLPHLGAGVGQGFEDTPPRANMVLERSIRMGKIYENYGPGLYDIPEMVQRLAGMWEPVWDFNLQKQVTRALEDFEESKQE